MAKIYGLFGSMTGKLADTVMSVRNGEQIARKYQPVVYNPSTPTQIAQRAKMKLISQLSAVMANVIAIAKQGAVSSRNLFTKLNFPALSYSNGEAQVTLTAINLTGGILGLPGISVTRENNNATVALTAPADGIDAVTYVAFSKMTDNTLRYASSVKVTNAGGSNMDFPGTISVGTTEPIVVYAYGIRLNNESARVKYGNLIADPAETIASLVTTSAISQSDYTLTETRAIEVAAYTPNQHNVDGNTRSKK